MSQPLPWFMRRPSEWSDEDWKEALISKVYNLVTMRYGWEPARAMRVINSVRERGVFDNINKQRAVEIVDQLAAAPIEGR